MSIQFKKLNRHMNAYKHLKTLYNSSFPKEERAPFGLLKWKANRGKADFLAAFDGDAFIGLVYMVCDEDIAYIFYLAVNAKLRAKGYGSQIISELKDRYSGKKLFLALEADDEHAPNIEERQHRRKFYEKNGFKAIPCKLKEATVIYDVMSIDGVMVTAAEYDALITKWAGKLLKSIIDMRIIENAR